MQADEMVDAALAGLDLGELITIPALPDVREWESYDAARKAMAPKLSRAQAADRYKKKRAA
jgi:short-subunit dehydrogenase